jgi:hypothetical protein
MFEQFNILCPSLDLTNYGKMLQSPADAAGIPEQFLTKGPSIRGRTYPALADRGFWCVICLFCCARRLILPPPQHMGIETACTR